MANQDTLEQVAEVSRLETYKKRELGFTASFIDTVTSGGGTINMHISNPSDSGVAIDVIAGLISSQFSGEFRAYDSFSSAPTGDFDYETTIEQDW
jgi:hypothetical protein